MTRQKNAKPNVFKYTAKFVAINLRKNGMLSLYLQVFINRERLRIPLNIFVKPEDWIANREIIIGSSPENADLNLLLQGHKAKLHEVIMYFRLRHKTFDKNQFLERFNLLIDHTCFVSWMQSAIEKHRSQIAKSTYNGHKQVHRILREYNSTVCFEDIDYNWVYEFDRYLTGKKRLSINTRSRYLKVIKFYLKLAKRQGQHVGEPFENFTLKQLKGNKVSMTFEELKQLHQLFIDPKTPVEWKNVLQYYLFSCYTGLRYSDYSKINHKNIEGKHLVVQQQKVRNKRLTDVRIPIMEPVYFYFNASGNFFNRVYSLQYSNRILKKICDHLGLKKWVTLHTGRHTCGTIFAALSAEPQMIMRILGHSKLDQSMDYIHLSSADLSRVADRVSKEIMEVVGLAQKS